MILTMIDYDDDDDCERKCRFGSLDGGRVEGNKRKKLGISTPKLAKDVEARRVEIDYDRKRRSNRIKSNKCVSSQAFFSFCA